MADTEGLSFSAVWSSLAEAEDFKPVFVKDFAYSVEHELTNERLADITSAFLREPRRVIQELTKYWPACTRDEVGFTALHRLFHRIADRDGEAPPLLLSADLLKHPGKPHAPTARRRGSTSNRKYWNGTPARARR